MVSGIPVQKTVFFLSRGSEATARNPESAWQSRDSDSIGVSGLTLFSIGADRRSDDSTFGRPGFPTPTRADLRDGLYLPVLRAQELSPHGLSWSGSTKFRIVTYDLFNSNRWATLHPNR